MRKLIIDRKRWLRGKGKWGVLSPRTDNQSNMKPPKPFHARFKSVGNPDHAQYTAISDPQKVEGDTMRGIVNAAMRYILDWNLGGGNWPPTYIYRGHKKVAKISYNGRVWDMNGKEIAIWLSKRNLPKITWVRLTRF